MLGFTVGIIAVITILATAGYAVAEIYRFLRWTVSRKGARPEVAKGEPVSGLTQVILSGVPRVSPEPPPSIAELRRHVGRDRTIATSGSMRRSMRAYNLRAAAFVILCALFCLGILAGLITVCERWEAFRNGVLALLLHLPWLLAGFIIGVVAQAREARLDEKEREQMFPGRCEQNREYEAYRLQRFRILGR